MSSFDELLAKLNQVGKTDMTKSMPAEEEQQRDGEGEGEGEQQEGLTKSFVVTDENGDEHEAIDASELLKSMNEELTLQKAAAATQSETLMKSLSDLTQSVLDKLTTIVTTQTAQDTLLKALDEKIETIQGTGRGRKSTLTLVEKPDASLQKSQPAGMDADEFMAKAIAAQKDGKIQGIDICVAEGYLNNNLEVPPEIVQRVLSL